MRFPSLVLNDFGGLEFGCAWVRGFKVASICLATLGERMGRWILYNLPLHFSELCTLFVQLPISNQWQWVTVKSRWQNQFRAGRAIHRWWRQEILVSLPLDLEPSGHVPNEEEGPGSTEGQSHPAVRQTHKCHFFCTFLISVPCHPLGLFGVRAFLGSTSGWGSPPLPNKPPKAKQLDERK